MVFVLAVFVAAATLMRRQDRSSGVSFIFTGFTNHELGKLALFQVRNDGTVKVRLWSASAIQVWHGHR
jgi:hypothetical protein